MLQLKDTAVREICKYNRCVLLWYAAHADSCSYQMRMLCPVTREEQVLKAKEEEVEELRRELALLRNPGRWLQTYPRFGFGYTWMHLDARDM